MVYIPEIPQLIEGEGCGDTTSQGTAVLVVTAAVDTNKSGKQ